MPNVLCLLNHELTEKQRIELSNGYAVDEILVPPPALKTLWASIPTGESLSRSIFSPIVHWLGDTSRSGDYLVIQGEFGATFFLIEYAFAQHLIPLHSVTKRIAQETRVAEIVYRSYVFEHIRFRRYIQYNKEGHHGYSLSGIE